MKPVMLVGGGGHCKSVIEVLESAGREVAGVLDLPQNVGQKVLGHPIVGTDQNIEHYVCSHEFVITVGHIRNAVVRRRIAAAIHALGGAFATVIASTAHVSRYAQVGAGTVILHGAVVNAGAVIGENCIINTLSNIEHDVLVEEFCHISTGAMINGDCFVGHDTFVGSQSVVLNGASICAHCVIAAGSFVRKSVHVAGIYAGNPARLMIKNA